jgi:hypothetical protein
MCEILKCYTIVPITIYLQKRTDVCIRPLDFFTSAHRQKCMCVYIDQTIINYGYSNGVSSNVVSRLSQDETSCKEQLE